jgi:hypothetical protein
MFIGINLRRDLRRGREKISCQRLEGGIGKQTLTDRSGRHADVAVVDRGFPDEFWRCKTVR